MMRAPKPVGLTASAQAPYWQDRARQREFHRLDRDLDVDVAIVGGGITGITAAYLLQRAGHRVALLDRGRCAEAETGHTTAHLTCVTDLRLSRLVASFEKNHAQAAWDAGLAAIAKIEDIVRAERIGCDFGWVPGYLQGTWDCPCHGSRFSPTGNVIGGPGESPLPE